MKRKGQIWSFDLALSLLIFFTAMLSMLFAWSYMSSDIAETRQIKTMQLRALTVSDSIIRTPGIPLDWNESNVEVIGLASSDNTLVTSKVDSFMAMEYGKARALLGVSPYDFYMEIKDINGTIYKNTTLPISGDADFVVPAERYAVYRGRIIKLRFILWD